MIPIRPFCPTIDAAFTAASAEVVAAVSLLLGQGRDLYLFVRHAESKGQTDPSLYQTMGDDRIPVTRFGRLQTVGCGLLLNSLFASHLWGSCHITYGEGLRLQQTAQTLAQTIGVSRLASFTRDSRLNKQTFGKFDGLLSDQARAEKYPSEYRDYNDQLAALGAFRVRPPGGESLADIQDKSDSFADFWQNRSNGKGRIVVAVTHGTNCLLLENALCERGEAWVLDRVDTRANCSLRLVFDSPENQWSALSLGEGRRPIKPVTPPSASTISISTLCA